MPNPGFWFKDDWPQILEENCYCLNPTNMTVNSTVTPLSFATLGTVRTSFLNILLKFSKSNSVTGMMLSRSIIIFVADPADLVLAKHNADPTGSRSATQVILSNLR